MANWNGWWERIKGIHVATILCDNDVISFSFFPKNIMEIPIYLLFFSQLITMLTTLLNFFLLSHSFSLTFFFPSFTITFTILQFSLFFMSLYTLSILSFFLLLLSLSLYFNFLSSLCHFILFLFFLFSFFYYHFHYTSIFSLLYVTLYSFYSFFFQFLFPSISHLLSTFSIYKKIFFFLSSIY